MNYDFKNATQFGYLNPYSSDVYYHNNYSSQLMRPKNINSSIVYKFIVILIYIIIIIMIPIFLDYLFRLTVRAKRQSQIKYLAEKRAKETKKPLVIFNGIERGTIVHLDGTQDDFTEDISVILNNLNNDTFVIIISNVFEYIDNPISLFNSAKKVSGGDLFILGFEKKSTRPFIDYKIKNILDKPYFLPSDEKITLKPINNLQKQTQNIYKYLFKVIPYNYVMETNLHIDKC